jgi:hypothetical protein
MSKRGYVHHAHHSVWIEEKGVMRVMSLARRRRRSVELGGMGGNRCGCVLLVCLFIFFPSYPSSILFGRKF